MDEDSELTVPESIHVTICKVEAVIETVFADDDEDAPQDAKRLYLESRDQLSKLLQRLNDGLVTPEYAEVELAEIDAALDQWARDNPIPP